MSDIGSLAEDLGKKIAQGGRAWLFLDYDGTLEDFAPTPDTIVPDPDLIDLLTRLAKYKDALRVVIMSGRSYRHIHTLLPVQGILEAGTYGIEFNTWDGERVNLLDFETERPLIDQLKRLWADLVEGRGGYYLEDKGYSIALHGRYAPDDEVNQVILEAARIAKQAVQGDTFRILGGHRFIEVAPTIADKGQSVSMLLKRFPWPDAEILYFGDDDKDEDAFQVVARNKGIAVLVSPEPRSTHAAYRLDSPVEVRQWLQTLAETIEHSHTVEHSQED